MDLYFIGDEEFFILIFLFFEKFMIWDSIKWGINIKNFFYIVYFGFLFVIKLMLYFKYFIICYLKMFIFCKEFFLFVF